MVGITKVQRANASYWIEAVAEGGEDYYAKPGPKSVSLIYALGDEEVRERTLGAYDSAVAAGMHYLEQEPALSSGEGAARRSSPGRVLSQWPFATA
jgi:hypothetical protein